MPEIAKQIKVQRNGRPGDKQFVLLVDGKEFPWHITDGGVKTQVAREGLPSVTLTLLADEVVVEDRL